MTLRIKDVPEHERPRERLLARGVEALSERELLALVLRNGRQGESALDVAAALLAEFGSLEA
ncbi:MAG: DNA repair protein, partial [Thermoleophilia bacterium]|nr:DNA repair protein [Thermoleophilia bacterium]